jgi:type I restriction enzyme M protein
VETLGYQGSGDPIRGFNFQSVLDEIETEYHGKGRKKSGVSKSGSGWRWFTRSSLDVATDATKRFDLKYWEPDITAKLAKMEDDGVARLSSLNIVKTKRGKSPAAALYVDEGDGHALVIKAGSNISRYGMVSLEGDYVEKNVYDEMKSVHVEKGDILLSSTGDGTLGKCAVYREGLPAIFDGHVTLIRVDETSVYPEYVCDYLRAGFGALQIARLYTGSTGLIELPPDQVGSILIPLPKLSLQKAYSIALRKAEADYVGAMGSARGALDAAVAKFVSV